MKSVSFILSLVVVIFSTQPLVPALAQEMTVQEHHTGPSCCSDQSDCCCSSDSDAGDTRECGSEQGCPEKCQCVTHTNTVNAVTGSSAQINMFGVYMEMFETLSMPYHLILPVSIWHPPQS